MSGKLISNMIWRFAERSGAQIVSFIVSIILARLLNPSVYGTIALVTVFISILQVFVDSGLGNALIQKKDADHLDFSTVFFTNVFICVFLYIVLFFSAPLISRFYGKPELTSIVRVLGITLLISGVKNIQQAYVSRNLLFRKFFFATLGGTLGSAVFGIVLAYKGYGVWALVGQHLFNLIIDTIILWFTVKWRPRLEYSFLRLKSLYSYGWKLLVSSLINTFYNELRQLLIGKLYTSEDLAYYNKSRSFPSLVITNISTSIDSVLFPAMSKVQSERESVKYMTRMSIRTSSYIIWPFMFGLIAISEPLTRLLLTDKWLPIVPYMRVFCIGMAFQPIHTANLNAIKAMGRSDLYLKLEVLKKSFGLLLLAIFLPYGPFSICCSNLIYALMAQIVNSFPNRKLLGYSYIDQLKDIIPFVMMSALMCLGCILIVQLNLPDIIVIFLQVIFGVVIYLVESILFKTDIFIMLKEKAMMSLQYLVNIK